MWHWGCYQKEVNYVGEVFLTSNHKSYFKLKNATFKKKKYFFIFIIVKTNKLREVILGVICPTLA